MYDRFCCISFKSQITTITTTAAATATVAAAALLNLWIIIPQDLSENKNMLLNSSLFQPFTLQACRYINFIITVPVDGLSPNGTRPWPDTVLTTTLDTSL